MLGKLYSIKLSRGVCCFKSIYSIILFILFCRAFVSAQNQDSLTVNQTVSDSLLDSTSIESNSADSIPETCFSSDSGQVTLSDSSGIDSSVSAECDSSHSGVYFQPGDTVSVQKPITAYKNHQIKRTEDFSKFYPGITREQDRYARQIVSHYFSLQWDGADRAAKKMQRLERRENLPPLSYLLLVSGRVIRIQNGEYESERDLVSIEKEVMSLSEKALKISDPQKNIPDSLKVTYMLINSGIKGFVATLKISKNPMEAAIEGFGALRMLEKLIEMDPQINDAYLGLGIFYCALAKAPGIIRGALNIGKRNISFDKGLDYLRLSAYQGRYTCETAKLYLIQFLTPYLGHTAQEKERILASLQSQYIRNPAFLFYEIDENLCFHRSIFTAEYRQSLRKKIKSFKPSGYSSERYINLLKWQYSLIDSTDTNGFHPDTGFDLREYRFYPVFLNSLKRHFLAKRNDLDGTDRGVRHQASSRKGATAVKLLEASDLSYNRKNFYSWHIRDALR